jgi:hypothetical protein
LIICLISSLCLFIFFRFLTFFGDKFIYFVKVIFG